VRILIVNQFFEPDPAATAQCAAHLGRRLVERGHEVRVVASRFSHILDGATLPKRETIDGMQVRRVGGTNLGKGATWRRIIDTGSFYAALAWRVLLFPRADAVLLMSSPPMIETLGPVVRLTKRCWVGCWLMDLNPDLTVETGVLKASNPLMRLCRWVGSRAMRRIDRVIAIGPCMAERVERRGVDPAKISVIETGADPDALVPLSHESNDWRREQGVAPDRPILMYSGNMGIGHPLATFLDGHRRLSEEGGGDPGCELVLIGGGVRRRDIDRFVSEHAPTHLRAMGYQPFERLNQSLAAGDIHLISQAEGLTGAFIPSKVYGIMGVGRPFIFVGPRESTVGRIAEEGPCGVVVAPGDVAGYVRAVRSLLDDAPLRRRLGEAGRRLLETKYARRACEDRLIAVLERAGGAPAPAPDAAPAG
jgi:glycosyltransferase involved in cell wall biosynthesis